MIQLSCKLAFAPSSCVNRGALNRLSTQGNALLLLPGLLCSTLLRTSGDSNLIHFTMGSFVAEKTSFTMRTARFRVTKQGGHYCPILKVVPWAIALCVAMSSFCICATRQHHEAGYRLCSTWRRWNGVQIVLFHFASTATWRQTSDMQLWHTAGLSLRAAAQLFISLHSLLLLRACQSLYKICWLYTCL